MPTPGPAPSFDVLFDFETQIETIFAAILQPNLASLSALVYTSRSGATIQTPAVMLRFVQGGPLAQRAIEGGRLVPTAFEGTIIAEIWTGRKNGDDARHGALRGRVRYLLSPIPNLVDDVNNPFLEILEILPTGSSPQITDEKEIDRSALQFSVKFAIRETAWPST